MNVRISRRLGPLTAISQISSNIWKPCRPFKKTEYSYQNFKVNKSYVEINEDIKDLIMSLIQY